MSLRQDVAVPRTPGRLIDSIAGCSPGIPAPLARSALIAIAGAPLRSLFIQGETAINGLSPAVLSATKLFLQ